MALIISQGSGATIATEAIGGEHYGKNKIYGGVSGSTIGWNINADGSGNVGIVGNVTLSDSKGFIGAVSVSGFANPMPVSGTFWQTTQPVSPVGNVTLSDSKTYVGLVTATVGNNPVLGAGVNNIGFASVTPVGAWPDPKGFIGSVSVSGLANPMPVSGTFWQTTQPVSVVGNVTLSDSKTFVGLVTVGGIGTVTLADPKGFIGLVTTIPTYLSAYTSLATTISASGAATLVVPPSNQTIYIKNLLITSLGRSEVNVAMPTVPLIPYSALATQGGIVEFYGEGGQPFPAQNTALVVNLNGAATIGVRVNLRFV